MSFEQRGKQDKDHSARLEHVKGRTARLVREQGANKVLGMVVLSVDGENVLDRPL